MTELGQKVIGEVRRLAKENPRASAGCKYFEEDPETLRPLMDQPCCIVGNAVYNLGLVDLITDSRAYWGWNQEGISELERFASEASQEEVAWLAAVQEAQDDGYKWGDAVALADEEMC